MKLDKKHLVELYKTIYKKIKAIDFDLLYPGFKPFDFALYNDKIVVMKDKIIPYDERFLGNTAIYYHDAYLAIWKIDTIYLHYNILTSKIVHEMFHAWQRSKKERRFPNEFQGLGYSYEKYNISLKFDETRFLLKAVEDQEVLALQKFASLREKRRRDYPNEIMYEEGIETIEGMAKYIELLVLKFLDVAEYQKAYDLVKNNLKNIKNYIPIRSISYDVGALMLLAKDSLKLDITHEIGEETRSVYNILFNQFEHIDFTYENNNLNLDFLEAYYENIIARITSVLTSNPRVHNCQQIVGFDPLNSFRIDRYIYYRHFVMIECNHNKIFIPNESVGELNDFNQVYVIYERVI